MMLEVFLSLQLPQMLFSEDVARVLRSGMNAHIAKPIDFNVLQEVMKAHLK